MRTTGKTVVALLLGALATLCGGAVALADGAPAGGDVHVAQTLGDRELTVVLRRVDAVPGPLRVDVITHRGSAPGELRLRVARPGGGGPEVVVALGAAPGPHHGTLRVEAAGPQELAVDDGEQVALIPFVVPVAVMSPAEDLTYRGFVAAGLLLLVALGTAVTARRGWVVLLPAGGFVAALAVAVTAALLSASTPAPPRPGEDVDATEAVVRDPYSVPRPSTSDLSRPPVTPLLRVSGTGDALDLELSLADGASGRPVDDLLVHDDALVHLVVVTPSGGLRHVHPVRVAPGEYRVRLRDPEPGHHAVSAEVSRRGGGVQLLRSPTGFDVPGERMSPSSPPGAGARDVAGTPVDVAVTGARAGAPTTITARVGTTADLQPWLGMVGHLIVVGPLPDGEPVGDAAQRAPVWAHAHAMVPITPGASGGQPDETVAAYGPGVTFTHTFPLPGRYRLWVQNQRDYALVTTPVLLDVGAGEGGAP
jgi:hypothetical protein